jgi:hypothetical protein
MKLFGIAQVSSNMALQWYVIAMYGPSFVTGHLIARFGATKIVLIGLALMAGIGVLLDAGPALSAIVYNNKHRQPVVLAKAGVS